MPLIFNHEPHTYEHTYVPLSEIMAVSPFYEKGCSKSVEWGVSQKILRANRQTCLFTSWQRQGFNHAPHSGWKNHKKRTKQFDWWYRACIVHGWGKKIHQVENAQDMVGWIPPSSTWNLDLTSVESQLQSSESASAITLQDSTAAMPALSLSLSLSLCGRLILLLNMTPWRILQIEFDDPKKNRAISSVEVVSLHSPNKKKLS